MVAALVLLVLGCSGEALPRRSATLERVVDGDTIIVRLSGARERLRYIGIDTPESVAEMPRERLGKEAAAHNARVLKSGPLLVEFDVQRRDRFGRLLAYVWAGDVFVNRRLVLDGYAQVATFPPNVRYEAELLDAQRKAREAKVGLWRE